MAKEFRLQKYDFITVVALLFHLRWRLLILFILGGGGYGWYTWDQSADYYSHQLRFDFGKGEYYRNLISEVENADYIQRVFSAIVLPHPERRAAFGMSGENSDGKPEVKLASLYGSPEVVRLHKTYLFGPVLTLNLPFELGSEDIPEIEKASRQFFAEINQQRRDQLNEYEAVFAAAASQWLDLKIQLEMRVQKVYRQFVPESLGESRGFEPLYESTILDLSKALGFYNDLVFNLAGRGRLTPDQYKTLAQEIYDFRQQRAALQPLPKRPNAQLLPDLRIPAEFLGVTKQSAHRLEQLKVREFCYYGFLAAFAGFLLFSAKIVFGIHDQRSSESVAEVATELR